MIKLIVFGKKACSCYVGVKVQLFTIIYILLYKMKEATGAIGM